MKAIERLAESAKGASHYNNALEVKTAFKFGLFHSFLPPELIELCEPLHSWYQVTGLEADIRINFTSDTGDSWHNFYRIWREKGWERRVVKREGGLLQYVLAVSDPNLPVGYQELSVRLDISISTCKRVSKGFRTVEEEIFELECEDLAELPEDSAVDPAPTPAEPDPLF